MSQKIFIVGAGGMVGSVCAYNILLRELVEEIILIDLDLEKLEGQVMDLFHSSAFSKNTKVRSGNYSDIENDDIVIITAGVAQKSGQSRLELIDINKKVIEDIIDKIMARSKDVFIFIVSNPVDVLTYIALKKSGLPKNRVFGSGSVTDSARLIAYLSNKLKVNQSSIEAYVFGEHGESCFAALSTAKVNGENIKTYIENNKLDETEINNYIRTSADKIIASKGATYFGIATVVGEILDSLINNKNKMYSVCSLIENSYGLNNVVLGLPHNVNVNGVDLIEDFTLNENEQDNLRKSAEIVAPIIRRLGY